MAARRFRHPPLWDAIDHAARGLDKTADLEVKYINSYKGRGVFAKAPFLKGDFVVEYRGELISSEESQSRRSIYHSRCTVFMFDFYCRERAWCVDAAQEDGSLGRLVNDDHYHPNCKIKKAVTEGKARLFLFATKDISAGEEITYDYGGTDCPWRKKAAPQTSVPESSRTPEEAPQGSFSQMKSRTLSSDSEVSVNEEEQDSVSRRKRTKNMPSLQSEIDSDSDEPDDYNPCTSEDGPDTSDDAEPRRPTKDTLQCLSGGSLKQLPVSASSPLTEAGEAAGSLCTTMTYKPKQHCLFCKLGVGEIGRHLEQAHHNEPEVAQAFSFPTGSKERQMCLEYLISRGNFAHSVSNAGVGKTHIQAARASPPSAGKGEFGKLFVDTLRDATYHAMRSDVCIMEYGEDLYNRLKFKDGKKEYVRDRMRVLGRLLICSRKISPMRTIRDYIAPANFMYVVQAVKHLAGFDRETNKFKSPSIPLKIGNSLVNIAMLVERRANEQNDHSAAHDARAFRKVYDKRWHELVSAASRKALGEIKYNAPLLLAFTQDVQRLHCYLDVQRQRFQTDLCRRASPRAWSRLAKVTLTQVTLFNRRRTREVSNMPLSAYVSPEPQEDVEAELSHIEKKLCQNTRRVEMRGKRGRKQVVLLTPAMQQALDLLVSNRQKCKVPLGNTYLFGTPFTSSCYRGAVTLRHNARQCGAKNPISLSCSKLYRQMGTLSLVLNLGNAELGQLADLLGPGVRAHQQFYRLPAGTLQLAKISKVLMDLDRGGRLAAFKDKSLEDISIDPDETVQVGNEAESDSQDSQITSSHGETTSAVRGRRLFKIRWRKEEVLAVEKRMMSFIASGRVPAKSDCEACLKLETEALRDRSWSALKYYINNRIKALKRNASRDL